MKSIKITNSIAIGLPILLLLIGIIINDTARNYIAYFLYSLMITGFLQIILGLILLFKNPKSIFYNVYILAVIIFFALWYINVKIFYSDILSIILIPIPILLAIYLSILIYKS